MGCSRKAVRRALKSSKVVLRRKAEVTYLDEPDRIAVANAYVRHELKKARNLDDREREQVAAKIRSRVGDNFADLFIQATNPGTRIEDYVRASESSDLWKLFQALSYGWQEKELWNCVGLPEFRWELREISPERCIMQSPGRWLADVGLRRDVAVTTALEEAEVLAEENREELSHMIRGEFEQKSHELRTDDPLVGRLWHDGRVLIHDGNGRLQVWVAKVTLGELPRDSKVQAWVGIEGGRRQTHGDKLTLEQALLGLFPKRCPTCSRQNPGVLNACHHCGASLSP